MTDSERERIAAELHDGAMQELTLARLQLDLLAASTGESAGFTAQLLTASDALGEISERLQALMVELGPPAISRSSS